MLNPVIFNIAQGLAIVNGVVIPISLAGSHGELRIADGATLRPLSFGERSRVVAWALTTPSANAIDSLCGGILQTSRMDSGATSLDRSVLEILALALAGADSSAPTFVETALKIARAAGWSMSDIYSAEAAEIDRLALYLGDINEPSIDDGWTHIVFAEPEQNFNTQDADPFSELRRDLAERLLKRGDPNAMPNLNPAIEPSLNRDSFINEPSASALDEISFPDNNSFDANSTITDFSEDTGDESISLPKPSDSPSTSGRGYIRASLQADFVPSASSSLPLLTAKGLDTNPTGLSGRRDEKPRFVVSLRDMIPATNTAQARSRDVVGKIQTVPTAIHPNIRHERHNAPGGFTQHSTQLIEQKHLQHSIQEIKHDTVQTLDGVNDQGLSLDNGNSASHDAQARDMFFVQDVGDALAELLDTESDLRGIHH